MQKFYFLSILIHLVLWTLLLVNPPQLPSPPIKVTTISSSDLAKIKNKIQGQLVNTKNSSETTEEINTPYLSEKNQKVEKQTRSKNIDAYREKESRGEPAKKKISLKDLATPNLSGSLVRIQKSNDQTDGKKGDRDQDSASMDELPGVELGDETSLSTREFVYYSFYNRIHQKIEMLWPPILREKLSGLNQKKIVSPRETVDIVVLMNRKGVIEQIEIVEQSRLRELDSSAIEAFNRAGPFFNPPPGIVDRDGFIRMKWGFVLYTGSLVKYGPP